MIELGRIDIHIHLSMLSSFLAAPREGHLTQALHIFAYLKCYPCSNMVFVDKLPIVDESIFYAADWSEFYKDAQENIPLNAPEPRGKPVQMYSFCDADHEGDRLTSCSQTGIILFLNCASQVNSSLCYKLQMMVIQIDSPCTNFCENDTMMKNSTIPESVLCKKHNSIAYHRVKESVAAGILHIGYIHSSLNLADMFTKPLTKEKIHTFCEQILF
jgi:hypothetical protein